MRIFEHLHVYLLTFLANFVASKAFDLPQSVIEVEMRRDEKEFARKEAIRSYAMYCQGLEA